MSQLPFHTFEYVEDEDGDNTTDHAMGMEGVQNMAHMEATAGHPAPFHQLQAVQTSNNGLSSQMAMGQLGGFAVGPSGTAFHSQYQTGSFLVSQGSYGFGGLAAGFDGLAGYGGHLAGGGAAGQADFDNGRDADLDAEDLEAAELDDDEAAEENEEALGDQYQSMAGGAGSSGVGGHPDVKVATVSNDVDNEGGDENDDEDEPIPQFLAGYLSTATNILHTTPDALLNLLRPRQASQSLAGFSRRGPPASLSIRPATGTSSAGAPEQLDDMTGLEAVFLVREDGFAGRRQARRLLKERKRRRARKTGKYIAPARELPARLKNLFGEATLDWMTGNPTRAISKLLEIIAAEPSSSETWHLLAEITEEQGRQEEAANHWICAGITGDDEAWKHGGDLSRSLGKLDEAVFCYTKAVRLSRSETEALRKRAEIYKEKGEIKKEISTLNLLLRRDPSNSLALRTLAEASLRSPQPARCLAHFDAAFQLDFEDERVGVLFADPLDHMREDMTRFRARRVGYEELDALAGVYIAVGEYEKCLEVMKRVVRVIQGRMDESEWWDADGRGDYDMEFNEGAYAAPGTEGRIRQLTLALRVRFGVCRLMLDDGELAKHHFAHLYSVPRTAEMVPLYLSVADGYISKRLYATAVAILERLGEGPDIGVEVWRRCARCTIEMNELKRTVGYLNAVLCDHPDDTESKVQLVECYHELGKADVAMKLLTELQIAEEKARAARLAAGETQSRQKPDRARNRPVGPGEAASGIQSGRGNRGDDEVPSANELRLELENREKIKICLNVWNRAEAERIEKGFVSTALLNEFTKAARPLVQRFHGSKDLYPYDRRPPIISADGKIVKGGQTRESLASLSKRVGKKIDRSTQLDDMSYVDFQGLTLKDWYELCVRYAIILARRQQFDIAQATLETTANAVVFAYNRECAWKLHMHMLSVALLSTNTSKISEVCRWISNERQVHGDAFRLYSAMMSSGTESISVYNNHPNHKYIQRQINEDKKMLLQNDVDPVLLCLNGHIFLAGRTYKNAIPAYLRAYEACPVDPLINLTLGIAFLGKALTRQTENRHLQITQGLAFIFRYYDLRRGNAEACYNVARAFHQIGLLHLAIPYYERCLNVHRLPQRDSAGAALPYSPDLTKEVAYNLTRLYMRTGSRAMAAAVASRFLVV
ncbi:TPR-like protein [Gonapodya prolifera JEL478]|uniref:TPR-like protein n=1 Tax=Gonapodya prolifera (strain JEL478) TaxID=1344416 RepID=A0A139AYF2_GONPJ|nr:TPR-like protein [Gonapodya prolifera JEL478]|eukprot:KXS21759.1 TPR-like protein [Gonapodya prolifera JEL478]